MVGYDDTNNALTLGDDDSIAVGDYSIKYNSADDEWQAEYGRPIGGELGNHGEINGAKYNLNGQTGENAVRFDGIKKHIRAGVVDPANISVSAWINTDALPQSYSTTYRAIVGTSYASKFVLAWRSDTNVIAFDVLDQNGNTTNNNTSTTTVDENTEWIHVGGTYDGTETTVYVSGTAENTSTVASGNLETTNNEVYIGWDGDSSDDRYFPGQIDDVRIWNRALSSTEMSNVSNKQDVTSGLIHRWDFEYPETPNIAIDSVGDVYPQNSVPRSTSGSLVPQGLAESVSAGEALADDGNTYSSVQDAVNAASGWVFVGPGTFDGGVTVSTTGLTIEGSGYGTHIDGSQNSSGGISSSANNVTIRNLRVTGDINTSGTVGVDLNGTNCTIDNVTVVDSDDDALEIADDGIITNCTIEGAGVHGVRATGSRIIVTGCYITNVEFDGVDTSNDDNIVANNIVDNPTRNGIGMTDNDGIAIGNRVIGAGKIGLKIAGTDTIVANNRVSDSTNDDIDDRGTGTVLDENLTGPSN